MDDGAMPRMSASNLAIAADSRPLRLKTSTTEDNIENRMVTDKDKMLSGEMYDATVPQLTAERQRARDLCQSSQRVL